MGLQQKGVAHNANVGTETYKLYGKILAVGDFRLPEDLAPGKWRDLTEDEIAALLK